MFYDGLWNDFPSFYHVCWYEWVPAQPAEQQDAHRFLVPALCLSELCSNAPESHAWKTGEGHIDSAASEVCHLKAFNVYLLITWCASCVTQPSRAFSAHNSGVFIAYPPGQRFSAWPANRNRMFSLSVTNVMTNCRAQNGSQIYLGQLGAGYEEDNIWNCSWPQWKGETTILTDPQQTKKGLGCQLEKKIKGLMKAKKTKLVLNDGIFS